ncbi:MAG: hypothetical protein ACODAJ_03860 [Planctomycetota bacterium]
MSPRPLMVAFLAVLCASCAPVERRFREDVGAWPEDAPWPAWAAAGTQGSGAEALTAEEVERWLRWAIPLPKRVRFQGKLTLPAEDLAFRLRRGATDVERSAFIELGDAVAEQTGTRVFRSGFPILIGVVDDEQRIDGTWIPGARYLTDLPNADQAYVITPLPCRGLAVAALSDRGVYHGCKTLAQFLDAHSAEGRVVLPMVAVLDWPDLAERGQWGGSAVRDVPWLAEHKMNLVEVHAKLALDDQGRGVATLDAERQEAARLQAVQWVPIITHLDLLARTGLYERYPELRGKGEQARGSRPSIIAPCFSQPKMADLLADWFADLAAAEGVSDICVWLSEHHVHCGCERCQAAGQYALEAQACVRAWQLAREKRPQVRLRILTTQGSYATNDKVLAAVADHPEVGVTYYDGGRTYNSSREPMIDPLLEGFARRGRWLGVYPQLTASWRIVCPWSGPQFVKARMTEFADKSLSGLCGYATPDNRFYRFNVLAAAEWSWNAHGRTPREFALAWATRRGLADPEGGADWATTLGPVGWDVYGSRIPYNAFFGRASRLIRSRREPALGEGMFRYFPTVARLEEDLATCQRAMTVAQHLREPDLIAETAVIRGYVRMVRAIHGIAQAVAGKKKLDAAQTRRVQATFDRLAEAGLEVTEGLELWKDTVAPDCGASRFFDTVNVTHETVSGIATALAPLGIQDSGKPYRPHKVGSWTASDFDEAERITKEWDVTDSVSGPGTYRVRFAYTRGWWGLRIHRAALVAVRDGQRTVACEDVHHGSTGNRSQANVYTLKLATHAPDARYLLVADIKGVSSKGKPANRRGCEGAVWMVRRRGQH